MFIRVRIKEYLSQQEYEEIGKFSSIFVDTDTECLCLSLNKLNDLYIPMINNLSYEDIINKIYDALQSGKKVVTLTVPCIDISDDTWDNVQDFQALCEEIHDLSKSMPFFPQIIMD